MRLKAAKILLKRFAEHDGGATAIEYGVIIAILSLSIIGAGTTVWATIENKFVFIGEKITEGGT